jgi:hypothetical protein
MFLDWRVGLAWKPRCSGRSTFDGSGATGRNCGYVTNISGRWTIYLTPWACGREGGLLLGPFQGAPAAMAAANEYVAVYLAGKGEPP